MADDDRARAEPAEQRHELRAAPGSQRGIEREQLEPRQAARRQQAPAFAEIGEARRRIGGIQHLARHRFE